MKRLAGLIALFVFAAAPLPLMAYPDGAPWGSADPASAENCASCHYDGDAIVDSEAVSFSYERGELYAGGPIDVYVQFKNPNNKKTGFQIRSSAGAFTSEYDDIEANDIQARSLAQRDNASWPEILGSTLVPDVVMWKLRWTVPETSDGDVYFWIAVNESNDDQSPFGDQIHFKTIRIGMPGKFWLLPPL